jgi:hypothetical protein
MGIHRVGDYGVLAGNAPDVAAFALTNTLVGYDFAAMVVTSLHLSQGVRRLD